MNPLEVVVRILISQLLRGSTPRADNAKACFWWQILVPRFWGSFFAIFGDFRGVNVKFCVFDPQKALPYPKRHLLVYFMKLSDKRCGLHPSSRTPKRWKNAIEAVYVGYLPASDPLCKCYEIWHGGSSRVRNRSDRCWSTPVNRFRCVATPNLGPFHWQGPSGLLHCGSRYRGNAWFTTRRNGNDTKNNAIVKTLLRERTPIGITNISSFSYKNWTFLKFIYTLLSDKLPVTAKQTANKHWTLHITFSRPLSLLLLLSFCLLLSVICWIQPLCFICEINHYFGSCESDPIGCRLRANSLVFIHP